MDDPQIAKFPAEPKQLRHYGHHIPAESACQVRIYFQFNAVPVTGREEINPKISLIPLCCVYRCYQHHTYACAGRIQRFKFLLCYVACFVQQFQPIAGFVGFLKGDLELCDKISIAVGILRLPDVCTDRGAASADLIGDDGFAFSFNTFTKLIMATAKSMDCVLNLLSDIFVPLDYGEVCHKSSK